jgi:hypothetical protein
LVYLALATAVIAIPTIAAWALTGRKSSNV